MDLWAGEGNKKKNDQWRHCVIDIRKYKISETHSSIDVVFRMFEAPPRF